MAQLLTWLAGAGARTSAGDPVSSGFAWFYQPGGGSTTQNVYADEDATEILTQPVPLDEGGRAVVYTIEPVRALIQDAAGVDVVDQDEANVTRAEAVQIDNAGWTTTYLDDALTDLYTSLGGTNGMYLESGGATPRTIKAKFSELSVSVKDFGAKGDGLAVDTTAIQAAINRVAALGGGEVYFPPGTYKIDQQLTCAVSGVSLRGAGLAVSIISGNVSALSMSGCDGFFIRDLKFTSASGAFNGTGFTFSSCTNFTIQNCYVTGYYVVISMSSCQGANLVGANHFRSPSAGAAAGRCLSLTDTSFVSIVGGSFDTFGAGSSGLALLGTSGALTVTGAAFTSTGYSVNFDINLTGTRHRFANNMGLAGTPSGFLFSGATMPAGFYQRGNGIDGYKGTLLSGGTFTPDLSKGWTFVVDCTTTGVANTVAVPTPPPAATDYGVYIDIVYYAHAGGALTAGSGFAAGYHVSAAASLVDTNRTAFRFWWDPDASIWRECSRSVTA